MAVDMFLKLTGIDGESADSKHKGEIEILSFSWGISSATRSASSRLSAGRKASLQDFSIVKYVDSSSPHLFVNSCEGSHIPEAHFTLRKAGENQQEYYKVTLQDVLISSVSPGGSAGSGMPAMEQISFSFGAAEISAVGPDGRTTTRSTCGGSFEEDLPPVLVDGQKK